MIEPAPGILLIADPFLKDPNFLRTVVFICEHNEEGTFGFVLNRKYENTMDELVPALEGYNLPLYYGGPVEPDTIHFLHQYPDQIPGSQQVMEGIYWGGDFELLIPLLKNKSIDFNKIRFFIGYSGWSGGQLNGEMNEKTWLTVEATRNLVFHSKCEEVWKDALRELGGDYTIMANFPIDPQLN